MDSLKKSAYALLAEYELVDVLEMMHLLITQEQFRRDTTADQARNPDVDTVLEKLMETIEAAEKVEGWNVR
jgi:hypothetical protein